MHVLACLSVCVHACMCRYPQKLEEGLCSQGLELHMVVSHPMWMLGTESSGKAAGILKITELSLQHPGLIFKLHICLCVFVRGYMHMSADACRG